MQYIMYRVLNGCSALATRGPTWASSGEKGRSCSGVPVETLPCQTRPKRRNCEGGEDRYNEKKKNVTPGAREDRARNARAGGGWDCRSGGVVSSVHAEKGAMVGSTKVVLVVALVGVGPLGQIPIEVEERPVTKRCMIACEITI